MSTSKAPAQRPIAKPKSMSSKLLTMKFMQRSAAPTAVREALAKEESKRDAAREKIAAAVSSTAADAETRWELSYVQTVHRRQAAKVVDWGYSEILGDRREDSDEEDEEEGEKEKASGGRMVFGAFKSKGEAAKTEGDDGEKSDEGERGSEDGDGDGDGPRMVSLRGLTSISNAGPPPPGMKCRGCGEEGHTQANCPRARCYACDGEGHMAMDCPRPRRGRKRETMAYGSDSKRRRSGN